jgi:biotin operon repressor
MYIRTEGQGNQTARPPRRLTRLVRLVYLLLVEPGSATSEALESELGATRRTILRDLDVLRQAGLPVRYNRVEGHYQLSAELDDAASHPHGNPITPSQLDVEKISISQK